MDRHQYSSRGNAHRSAAATSSGKQKGRSGGSSSSKKPIKVVYISNPMRVTTSEAGFRSLVQELTGRNADPSKYRAGGSAVDVDVDVDESSAGSPVAPQGALPSPASTMESSEASGGHVAAAAYNYDDDDSFPAQLIDNRYSVFSPPTFLYGSYNEM